MLYAGIGRERRHYSPRQSFEIDRYISKHGLQEASPGQYVKQARAIMYIKKLKYPSAYSRLRLPQAKTVYWALRYCTVLSNISNGDLFPTFAIVAVRLSV